MKADRGRWGAAAALAVAAALLAGGYFWLKGRGYLDVFLSPERLQAEVARFGPAAPAAFFLLQFAQVIVSPIPGNVTTLAGGALFGFWKSFLISSAAVIAGSAAAFGLARAFGRPLVVRLAGGETVARYMDALADRQRMLLILFFLLPFFPDDALCLVAGLTGMRWRFFIPALALTRPWGLLVSALVGSGALSMPLWGWIAAGAASLALMIASARWGHLWEERLLSRLRAMTGRRPSDQA